jgi:FG-GAP repeat
VVVEMRRILVVLVLVLAAAGWPVASGRVQSSAATRSAAAGSLEADFNNDGFADLAVGAPFESIGGVVAGGAVSVLYGTPTGLAASGSQLFTQNSPGVVGVAEEGDAFGRALAAGDFNQDGVADLAIGAPGEEVGGVVGSGAINVLYGSAGKLTGVGSQLFTQDSPGIVGAAASGDFLGDALAAGDFNNDSFVDLAVGAANEAIGASQGGGAVNVLLGSAGLLTGVGSQLFTQDSPGVGDAAEDGDSFGFALTAADFDNDTFADLAVGAPFEDAGAVTDAGAVNVLYGSASLLTGTGSQLFTQGAAIGGTPEAFDAFGWALAGSGPHSATTSPATPASTSRTQRTAPRH